MIDNKLKFFFKYQIWHLGGTIILFYTGLQFVDLKNIAHNNAYYNEQAYILLYIWKQGSGDWNKDSKLKREQELTELFSAFPDLKESYTYISFLGFSDSKKVIGL